MTEILPRSDVPAQFSQQMQMAEVLANSTLLPSHLRKQPANVLLILAGARALNIPAFWALQSMHVIEGKLGMDATLMRALVVAAGHTFRVVERSAKQAVVEIRRSDRDEPYRAEYTWDDAKLAELTGKSNWKKYPKAMMVARATSIAVRDECPEVLYGVLYTPDELGAETDDEGNPVDDPRIVQMPDPEQVEVAFRALLTVDHPDDFAGAWRNVVGLGWAYEKPAGTDMSLLDRAVATLYGAIMRALDQDTLRTLWRLCGQLSLISMPFPDVNGTAHELGEWIMMRKTELAAADEHSRLSQEIQQAQDADARNREQEMKTLRRSVDRAQAAEAAKEAMDYPNDDAEPPVIEGEVAEQVERAITQPETRVKRGRPQRQPDTEHAEQMRQQAAGSWGDRDADQAK